MKHCSQQQLYIQVALQNLSCESSSTKKVQHLQYKNGNKQKLFTSHGAMPKRRHGKHTPFVHLLVLFPRKMQASSAQFVCMSILLAPSFSSLTFVCCLFHCTMNMVLRFAFCAARTLLPLWFCQCTYIYAELWWWLKCKNCDIKRERERENECTTIEICDMCVLHSTHMWMHRSSLQLSMCIVWRFGQHKTIDTRTQLYQWTE